MEFTFGQSRDDKRPLIFMQRGKVWRDADARLVADEDVEILYALTLTDLCHLINAAYEYEPHTEQLKTQLDGAIRRAKEVAFPDRT